MARSDQNITKRYFQSPTNIAFLPLGLAAFETQQIQYPKSQVGPASNNYLNARDRTFNYNGDKIKLRDVWETPGDFVDDAHKLLAGYANGQKGADTVGVQKRDILNSLAGFGTAENGNPFHAPSSAKSIIKSWRIDRTNMATPTDTIRPFKSESHYHQMKGNYLPSASTNESPTTSPLSTGAGIMRGEESLPQEK